MEKTVTAVPAIYTSLNAVMSEIHEEGGIGKNRKSGQGYSFRGIDDVFNALSPILAKHKVIIFPRVMSLRTDQHARGNGGLIFYSYIEVEYDFTSAIDGSKHLVRMAGEGMDVSDKSVNKAMSAAFKYACFQTFCIPTETDGMEDSENHSHQPVSNHYQGQNQQRQQQRQHQQRQQQQPNQQENAEVNNLIKVFWAAAHKGRKAFTEAWTANKCPARDVIEANKPLMTNYQNAVNKADHQEGNIPEQTQGAA